MRRWADAFTAVTRLLVVLAVALVGVLIPVGAAQATGLPACAMSAHAYDPRDASADLPLVDSDRGSPVFAVHDATCVIFEHRSYRASAPEQTAAALAVIAHTTYDATIQLHDVGQAAASLNSDPAPVLGPPPMSAIAPARGSPSISRVGGVAANAAKPFSRFAVNSAGETTMFLRAGDQALEVTEHAALRMTQRGVSIDAAEAALQQKPFQYFHQEVWKTGYYDPASKIFVGTVNGRVTTLIDNVTPKYIANLQAVTP